MALHHQAVNMTESSCTSHSLQFSLLIIGCNLPQMDPERKGKQALPLVPLQALPKAINIMMIVYANLFQVHIT